MLLTIERNLLEDSSATFSSCRQYRYRLDRCWNQNQPPLAFGMLNPSTADENYNDATIERCERRAKSLGFGSLIVWNLFAYRTVSPKVLRAYHSPVGPNNDEIIREVLLEIKSRCGTVIVGWGAHGVFLERHKEALSLARDVGIRLFCLGMTNSGQPKHPLYISYESKAVEWD